MAPNSPNKPASRNWNDIQMLLAALAMALTLGLWNLFAGPDRALAKESAQPTELPPPQPVAEQPTAAPTALPQVKIYLGGVAPQTQITITNVRKGGGGGGGGGTLPGTGGGGGSGGGGGGGGGTGSS
jgi:uncharacterized membrane protein YgcG